MKPSGGNGVKVVGLPSERTSKAKFSFTADYDGKENVVTGHPNWDTISLKQIDANNVTAVLKKRGTKFHMTDRLVVSPDGKTLTFTRNGTDADGNAVKNRVIVYERQ